MSQADSLRLMCVTAHPDDESLGFGGTIARLAREGVQVSLVVGTRGERGRYGDGTKPHPGPEELGRIREKELRAACDVLGVRELRFLGYSDGELSRADPAEAAGRIASTIRELRPHVIVTFDCYGAYGHPDHIAASQLALAGVLRASAQEEGASGASPAHVVQKLYYLVHTRRRWGNYERAFKVLQSNVGGEVRAAVSWPEWSITTTVESHEHWETVWAAVQCHRTQIGQYGSLARLTPDDHKALWGLQEYYRVLSMVNGGSAKETDLFEGIR